jgi:hypothetical protein
VQATLHLPGRSDPGFFFLLHGRPTGALGVPRKQERLLPLQHKAPILVTVSLFLFKLASCKQKIHVFLSADFHGKHPVQTVSCSQSESTVHTAEADHYRQ